MAMSGAQRPLADWVDIEAKLRATGADDPTVEQARAKYREVAHSYPDDLLPQDPTGAMPPRHFARAQTLGGYARHPDTGTVTLQRGQTAGPLRSIIQGVRGNPMVEALAGPDAEPRREPAGPVSETLESLSGLAPTLGGAAVIGATPLGALAAPLAFGGEAALREYQRESREGQPITPGRIALHGAGGAAVGALPVSRLAAPVKAMVGRTSLGPVSQRLLGATGGLEAEAAGLGAGSALIRRGIETIDPASAPEQRPGVEAPTLAQSAWEEAQHALPVLGGLHAGRALAHRFLTETKTPRGTSDQTPGQQSMFGEEAPPEGTPGAPVRASEALLRSADEAAARNLRGDIDPRAPLARPVPGEAPERDPAAAAVGVAAAEGYAGQGRPPLPTIAPEPAGTRRQAGAFLDDRPAPETPQTEPGGPWGPAPGRPGGPIRQMFAERDLREGRPQPTDLRGPGFLEAAGLAPDSNRVPGREGSPLTPPSGVLDELEALRAMGPAGVTGRPPYTGRPIDPRTNRMGPELPPEGAEPLPYSRWQPGATGSPVTSVPPAPSSEPFLDPGAREAAFQGAGLGARPTPIHRTGPAGPEAATARGAQQDEFARRRTQDYEADRRGRGYGRAASDRDPLRGVSPVGLGQASPPLTPIGLDALPADLNELLSPRRLPPRGLPPPEDGGEIIEGELVEPGGGFTPSRQGGPVSEAVEVPSAPPRPSVRQLLLEGPPPEEALGDAMPLPPPPPEAPRSPSQAAGRRPTSVLEAALMELDDRLASGTNAAGEPLSRPILEAMTRQRDDFRRRLGLSPPEPPGKAPAPVAAPQAPQTAGERSPGAAQRGMTLPPEIRAVLDGESPAWLRPPRTEGTVPTRGEQAMAAVDLRAFARQHRLGYFRGQDGTEVLHDPRLPAETLQALDAAGRLADLVNGPGTSPKPPRPTALATVRDPEGTEVRSVLLDDPAKAAVVQAAQPAGFSVETGGLERVQPVLAERKATTEPPKAPPENAPEPARARPEPEKAPTPPPEPPKAAEPTPVRSTPARGTPERDAIERTFQQAEELMAEAEALVERAKAALGKNRRGSKAEEASRAKLEEAREHQRRVHTAYRTASKPWVRASLEDIASDPSSHPMHRWAARDRLLEELEKTGSLPAADAHRVKMERQRLTAQSREWIASEAGKHQATPEEVKDLQENSVFGLGWMSLPTGRTPAGQSPERSVAVVLENTRAKRAEKDAIAQLDDLDLTGRELRDFRDRLRNATATEREGILTEAREMHEQAARAKADTAKAETEREAQFEQPYRITPESPLWDLPAKVRAELTEREGEYTPGGKMAEPMTAQGLYDPMTRKLTPKGETARQAAETLAKAPFAEIDPGPESVTKPGKPYTPDDLMPGGRAFKAVSRHSPKDDKRASLEGVYVSKQGTTVATDGFRLIEVQGRGTSLKAGQRWGTAGEINNGSDFPDYTRIIPEKPPVLGTTSVDRLQAVAKAAKWADGIVRVGTTDRLKGFDPAYVADAAQSFRDLGVSQVTVAWNETAQGEPMVLTGKTGNGQQVRVLIMPKTSKTPPARFSVLRFQAPTRKTTTLGAFGGRERTETARIRATTSDPEVDALFDRPTPGRLPWSERLRQASHTAQKAVGEFLGYETELRLAGDNQLIRALRKHKDTPAHVMRLTRERLTAVLTGLNEKAGELDLFERVVQLRDYLGRIDRGRRDSEGAAEPFQPGGLSRERYQAAHDELLARATPAVEQALQEHDALLQGLARQQVALGALHPSVLETEHYFPHRIRDYAAAVASTMGTGEGGTRRLQKGYRWWTKRAEGGDQPAETDYLTVMWEHLGAVEKANAQDAMAREWLPKRDILRTLSEARQRELFGTDPLGNLRLPTKDGQAFTIDGKPYRLFRYEGLKALGAESEFGFIPATAVDALALRAQARAENQAFLLPESAYNAFRRLTTKPSYSMIEQAFERWVQGDPTSGWAGAKLYLLDFIGARFHLSNFVGDLADSYRYSLPGTGFAMNPMHWGEIVAAIRGSHPDQAFQRLLTRQGVTEGSTFYGADLPGVTQATGKVPDTWGPRMKERLAQRKFLGLLPAKARTLLQEREAWLRVGQALWNYRRVKAGQPVWDGGIDIKGLSPEDAIGKVASTFSVDYGAISPRFERVRATLAPFATWYVQQASHWPTYLKRHPGRALAKFGLPAAAIFAWNHGHFGAPAENAEIEKRHPFWVLANPFHINLPVHTIQSWAGREMLDPSRDYWIGPTMGLDIALRLMHADRLVTALSRWGSGQLKPYEAVLATLDDSARRPFQALFGMIHAMGKRTTEFFEQQIPIVQALDGAASGIDPMTKRPIVPLHAQGTEAEAGYRMLFLFQRVLWPALSVAARSYDQAAAEKDNRLTAWLRDHAGDEGRALVTAFRTLTSVFDPSPALLKHGDTKSRETGVRREAGERANIQRRSELLTLEQAFIDGEARGDFEAFNQAVMAAMERGASFSMEDLRRRLQSPETRRLVAARKAELAPTSAARNEALDEQRQWEQIKRDMGYKRLPKSVRGVVEGMEDGVD